MSSDEKRTFKGGKRRAAVKVRSARGRKLSSVRWLQRQLNDPYVQQAKEDGYRSRAAYKLTQLDDMFHFLTRGKVVVDLGAAPGGWTQVAVERVKANKDSRAKVVGLDLQAMEPIPHATLLEMDFLSDDAPDKLKEQIGDCKVDVVLSDMAASSCGHTQTDHIRIMTLCEEAYHFAESVLNHNGVFVAKILRGGTEQTLLKRLKQHFTRVKHVKPAASRSDSSEMYLVAIGFKKGT